MQKRYLDVVGEDGQLVAIFDQWHNIDAIAEHAAYPVKQAALDIGIGEEIEIDRHPMTDLEGESSSASQIKTGKAREGGEQASTRFSEYLAVHS
jgi:hypothetical protein